MLWRIRIFFTVFLTVIIMAFVPEVCAVSYPADMAVFSTHTDAFTRLSSLINQRLSCMKEVARFKAIKRLPIEDIAQEQVVLARSVRQAKAIGLDETSISVFISAQMNVAKAIQYRYQADWFSSPVYWQPRHLDELRTEITRLNDALLTALHTMLAAGIIPDDSLYVLFTKIVNAHHVHDSDRKQLFTALKAVTLKKN